MVSVLNAIVFLFPPDAHKTYVPDSSLSTHLEHREDYYHLHTTFFTMLSNKFIVSFVVSLTLATSVTASATPPLTGTGKKTDSPNQVSAQTIQVKAPVKPHLQPGLRPNVL